MMLSPARVLIAEDHAVVRDGLRTALKAYDQEFDVVGEAEDGLEAVQKAKSLRPDLMLLDIRMPHRNGTDVLEDLRKRTPATKVIIFTQYQTEDYVHAAIAGGARGYFVKNDGMTILLEAMRTVLDGKIYLSPRIAHFLVHDHRSGSAKMAKEPSWATLTPRERTIIKLIVEGRKNREIATVLSLSVRSIETYRSQLLKKLQLDNTPALIRYALEQDMG